MRFAVFTILFLLVVRGVNAQVLTLPSDNQKFLEEFTKQTEKHVGQTAQGPNGAFVSWFGNIDENAKKEVISLMQYLSKKGLRPIELVKFSETLSIYTTNQKPSAEELQNFLVYLKKALEPLATKTVSETLVQLNIFFSTGAIYSSVFNKTLLSPSEVKPVFFEKKQNYFVDTDVNVSEKTENIDFGWDDAVEEYDPWKEDVKSAKQNEVDKRVNLPQVQGLLFAFENANLILVSPSDSIVLSGVSGAFNLIDGTLIGANGKLEWEVEGKKVSVVLDKFSYKSSSGRLIAEKASLSHEGVLEKEILGALDLKLEKIAANQLSTYPRFKSYHNDASYILPFEDSKLYGGYSILGQKVTTASMFDKFSKLTVNASKETGQFEVVGQAIILTDSLLSSDMVSFVARFGADSVSHPAIQWTFDVAKNIVQLNKVSRGGFRNSMFSDTFHKVDIRCDAMTWDLNTNKMDFYIVSAKKEVAAEFESFDNYNASRLSSLSSSAGFNPLMAAATLVGRKKKNEITVDEMMQFTKKERFMVSNGMLIGNQMGFFDYHPFGNYYSISRKGMHYYLVVTGKKDYDDLVFTSLNKDGGDKKNASIDFNTQSLDILGAQNFKLSDSLGIRFLPTDQSLKVIGNKVFSFSGKITVKNYTFYGDFVLEYEQFLVKLNRIDSITFIPLDIYKRGGKKVLAGNFDFGKTGTLYLNHPDNKSGRKNYPEYPKLEIPEGVTVHFNEKGRKHIFSDAVVFKADKLKLDSLNTKDPEIAGLFKTGGIFKDIKDKLKVLPDSSMGMNHKALGAYELYGSSTILKASENIRLTRNGIETAGELNHLSAVLNAEKLKLFEENSLASGVSGKIQEKELGGVYYPDVAISDFKMEWNPAKDSLAVASEKGFEFYKGTSSLKGALVIRKSGLFGNGDLARADSDISSKNFKFDKSGFLAEKSSIKVKAEEDRLAFSGKNVGIDFNVQKSEVKISSAQKDVLETEVGYLEFPSSMYKTTIDAALWKIKDKLITMEGDIENSVFTSTASHQYNLNFKGSGAVYNIDSKNLSITGVKEINAADAAIQPLGGKVFVKNDGKLEPFSNATIVADTLNRYHTLTQAEVTVNSKLSYSGNANYRYVNVSLDTFNIKLGGFEFNEISETGQILSSKGSGKLSTIARASVKEEDQVFLAKRMLYKGDLIMLAPFKNLSLKGQVLPDLKRYPMIGGSWIDYQGSKSENVSIAIDETLKDGGKPLYVGLHMKYGANTDGIYPSFLSMKGSSDDTDIFVAKGTFGRDEENKKFYVKPATETGNGVDFYDEKGIVEYSGAFNLLGIPTKVFETYGKAKVNLDSMKFGFETMMFYDFPISIPVTQKLGENIVKANLDAGNTEAANDMSDSVFVERLSKVIGFTEIEKYKNDLQKGPSALLKRSNKFLKTLVFSELNMKWNPTANAYHSVGPIGISNVGDVDVNARVNGYVEIVQSHSTGNEVHIYLDLSPTRWYYFIYRNGSLGMVSSDEEVNKLVNVPSKKEKTANFVDTNEASKFKKRFLLSYLGIKEEDIKKAPEKPKEKKKETATESEEEGF